ncbi:SRPBCC domain-containing protein [bacterium]|nr:SRPBCC domain-containing protein [bacterium]
MAKSKDYQTDTFVYLIEGVRKDFAKTGPNEEEGVIIGKHFDYLLSATNEGKLILAGPCTDLKAPGIVIFNAANMDEARAFLEGDPAVQAGVFRGSVHPMSLALLRSRDYFRGQSLGQKSIRKFVTVDAPVEEVWKAWTTEEGITSFFAPAAKIDLRVGGAYECYFLLDAPEGSRGGEGCKILSYVPNRMLSFTWNAPPSFPNVRKQYTHVVLEFAPAGPNKTFVEFTQLGWGEGEEWNQVYEYFQKAWDSVLGNLKERFSES